MNEIVCRNLLVCIVRIKNACDAEPVGNVRGYSVTNSETLNICTVESFVRVLRASLVVSLHVPAAWKCRLYTKPNETGNLHRQYTMRDHLYSAY